MKNLTYAIDFGTSNSLLAAGCDGKVIPPIPLDPLALDPTILRSILYFPDRSTCFFGNEAIREYVKHDLDGRFIRSVKKFLPMASFTGTQIGNHTISIEEIIATFLRELRKRANQFFQSECEKVLLGRPALFSLSPEEDKLAESRLYRAAELAGFKQIGFCAEPVAAANDFRATLEREVIALVSDFGGGTSDFTVIKLGPKSFQAQDVLALGGVPIAGDALDGAIMRGKISAHFGAHVTYQAPFGNNVLKMPISLMEKICAPADISLLRARDTMEFFRNIQNWSLGAEDRRLMEQLFSLIQEQFGFELFEEIERTKRMLSKQERETFHFSYPGIEINEEVSRLDFEKSAENALARILACLDKTVLAAGIQNSDIDIVYSTGGTAKVPALQQALVSRFGLAKVQESQHFHSVIQGLAVLAAQQG